MSKQDYTAFCNLFYNCSYIPLSYYRDDRFVLKRPDTRLDFISNYLWQLKESGKDFDYVISGEFVYYGIVKSRATRDVIVLGPVISTPCSIQTVRRIIRDCSIAADSEQEVSDFLASLPLTTFQQFLRVLVFVHYEVNGDEIDIFQYTGLTASSDNDRISALHSGKVYTAKEEQNFHNSYHFEREFLKCVENGNVPALKKILSNAAYIKEGIVADTTLRQVKNIFVTTATLLTRSAIAGGFYIEDAYQLSDVYITEMEKLLSVEAVHHLTYTMVIDFAEHVSKSKIPSDISPEIYNCIQFVSQNTNQPIQVTDVAQHVGKSRSYLSRKFKAEMGFELSAFIMRCKLEEARSLLAFTEKSLADISSYLCFSSQSYFHNVFKKKYGITPKEYRDHASCV